MKTATAPRTEKTANDVSLAAMYAPTPKSVLLDLLRDKTLTWDLKNTESQQSWPSAQSPLALNASPLQMFGELSSGPTQRNSRAGRFESSPARDYEKTSTDTLETVTPDHSVVLTRSSWQRFTHSLRREEHGSLVTATFTDLDARGRTITFSSSEFPKLSKLFDDLASRAKPAATRQ